MSCLLLKEQSLTLPQQLQSIVIVPNILAAHALSGGDTVACLHGINKVSVINTLTKGYT